MERKVVMVSFKSSYLTPIEWSDTIKQLCSELVRLVFDVRLETGMQRLKDIRAELALRAELAELLDQVDSDDHKKRAKEKRVEELRAELAELVDRVELEGDEHVEEEEERVKQLRREVAPLAKHVKSERKKQPKDKKAKKLDFVKHIQDKSAKELGLAILDRTIHFLSKSVAIKDAHKTIPGVWAPNIRSWSDWSHERQVHLPRPRLEFPNQQESEDQDFRGTRLLYFFWDVGLKVRAFVNAWINQMFGRVRPVAYGELDPLVRCRMDLSAALDALDGVLCEPDGPSQPENDPLYHSLCTHPKAPKIGLQPVLLSDRWRVTKAPSKRATPPPQEGPETSPVPPAKKVKLPSRYVSAAADEGQETAKVGRQGSRTSSEAYGGSELNAALDEQSHAAALNAETAEVVGETQPTDHTLQTMPSADRSLEAGSLVVAPDHGGESNRSLADHLFSRLGAKVHQDALYFSGK